MTFRSFLLILFMVYWQLLNLSCIIIISQCCVSINLKDSSLELFIFIIVCFCIFVDRFSKFLIARSLN